MTTSPLPLIISAGDSRGIGPEITAKALAQIKTSVPIIIAGGNDFPGRSRYPELDDPRAATKPGVYFSPVAPAPGEESSFACVRTAVDWALVGYTRAIVTAPISKKRWLDSGVPYPGHTDYLAARDQASDHAMCFWSADLKVALYTVHIPFVEVAAAMQAAPIAAFLRFLHRELLRLFKRPFTFYLCGFNPHAGEQGMLGSEERRALEPAVAAVAGELQIAGIFPADSVFLAARGKPDTLVVSWYHDQGLIPFKLLHLHDGVNLTLGLSFIRTSPDHGTAEDIAGKGIADPSSMGAAIQLALDLL